MNMKRKMNKMLPGLFIIGAVVIATGCKDDSKPMATLYTRLGGIDAIAAVTDKFIANVGADNVINAKFEATVADPYRLEAFRNNLVDQICAGAGGPCQYKGKTMAAAHANMGITDDEFTALVNDLVSALDYYKVAEKEKTDLLAVLGPLKSDIVGK